MKTINERVVILGASDKPARYSYKAFKMLQEAGHEVIPVSPRVKEIESVITCPTLKDVPGPVDTVTMYVSPEISTKLGPDIVTLQPKRVIFNPGSENERLAEILNREGVEVVEACTLVLLKTGQF